MLGGAEDVSAMTKSTVVQLLLRTELEKRAPHGNSQILGTDSYAVHTPSEAEKKALKARFENLTVDYAKMALRRALRLYWPTELEKFCAENNISVNITPPRYPDTQPIEYVWADGKDFVRQSNANSTTMAELKDLVRAGLAVALSPESAARKRRACLDEEDLLHNRVVAELERRGTTKQELLLSEHREYDAYLGRLETARKLPPKKRAAELQNLERIANGLDSDDDDDENPSQEKLDEFFKRVVAVRDADVQQAATRSVPMDADGSNPVTPLLQRNATPASQVPLAVPFRSPSQVVHGMRRHRNSGSGSTAAAGQGRVSIHDVTRKSRFGRPLRHFTPRNSPSHNAVSTASSGRSSEAVGPAGSGSTVRRRLQFPSRK